MAQSGDARQRATKYASEQLAAGHTRDEVVRALTDAGWDEAAANEIVSEALRQRLAAEDQAQAKPGGLAATALVLGIIGLIIWPLGVGALICGAMALNRGGHRGMAMAGVALGVIGTLLCLALVFALPAAVLLPVFARAREKARMASCQSNLKQVALAAAMYATDYDGCLPIINTAGSEGWPERLYPYLKNTEIYLCPADGRAKKHLSASGWEMSYGFNPDAAGVDTETLRDPATLAIFYDATALVAPPDEAEPRHEGGANTAYADGHVKWRRPE